MKKKWKITKKLVPENSRNSNKLLFEDVENKVEQFNQFFAKVGKETYRKTQESTTTIENNLDTCTNHSVRASFQQGLPLFRPIPVSVDVVILTFKRLKETNAVGSDNLEYRFIRDSLPVTAFYITIIVNTSIVTRIYATMWKHALV